MLRNRDMANGDDDPIEILTYTDGLGRVIQTKKDSSIYYGRFSLDRMTVSGRVFFDAGGRPVKQYYPVAEGKESDNTAFNPVEDSVNPTTYDYDAYDRVVTVHYPDTTSSTFAYSMSTSDSRLVTEVTDALGNKKRTYKDSKQQIRKVDEVDVHNSNKTLTTAYNYDPLSEMVQVVQDSGAGGQNITTFINYDLLGRRTHIINPDTGDVETKYDQASNVINRITPNLRAGSHSIEYHYDAGNRVTSIHYPDSTGDVAYTYGGTSDAGQANGNRAGRIKTRV
jgi:YD repeat-containing protein